jgi:hypothetical protein
VNFKIRPDAEKAVRKGRKKRTIFIPFPGPLVQKSPE